MVAEPPPGASNAILDVEAAEQVAHRRRGPVFGKLTERRRSRRMSLAPKKAEVHAVATQT